MLSRISLRQACRISTGLTNRFTLTVHPALRILAFSSPTRHISTSRPFLASTPMAAETDTQAEALQSSTGITPESLAESLKSSSQLSPLHVDIQDISGGCGASFAALIVSDVFKGKSALQRHRLVNGLLKEEIKAIHAWTPKCLTGEQWEAEKAKMQ